MLWKAVHLFVIHLGDNSKQIWSLADGLLRHFVKTWTRWPTVNRYVMTTSVLPLLRTVNRNRKVDSTLPGRLQVSAPASEVSKVPMD